MKHEKTDICSTEQKRPCVNLMFMKVVSASAM